MPTVRGPRVFLGPVEIAGFYTALAHGLSELGVAASLVTLEDHPFQYDLPPGPLLAKWVRCISRSRSRLPSTSRTRCAILKAAEGVLRSGLLLWAVLKFDAFVFGFGCTFLNLPGFELRILRLLRKRIICVFHGSDSRPPYLDGSLMASDRGRTVGDCLVMTRRTKARVVALDRLADYVVDNPLASHFHERPCINWFAIGIPQRLSEEMTPNATYLADGSPDRPVRILHSPSHPEAKGSQQIRRAIKHLRDRGHNIEFVEITGRPHQEVVRALQDCDFVVDQVYSDTPMAGFPAEAAYFGKPAVVGSYGCHVLAQAVAQDDWPPTALCRPENIENTIERMVMDTLYRLELGRRAYKFVRERWSARAVAERFLCLIEDRVPGVWIFDPQEILYLRGGGLSEEHARRLVREVVNEGSDEALMLNDKPELKRLLVEFAGLYPSTKRSGAQACSH